jgi:hypothetical protein
VFPCQGTLPFSFTEALLPVMLTLCSCMLAPLYADHVLLLLLLGCGCSSVEQLTLFVFDILVHHNVE